MGVHESNKLLCAALARKYLKLGCSGKESQDGAAENDVSKPELCRALLERILARKCDTSAIEGADISSLTPATRPRAQSSEI